MSQLAAPWTTGYEPGRQVVVLGVAGLLGVTVLDILLGGTVGLFFDLCFIVLCLGLAVLVDRRDFFVVGVLPPLLMLGAFVLLAIVNRGAIASPDDTATQAVVTAVVAHSVALTAGYALCAATLIARMTRD